MLYSSNTSCLELCWVQTWKLYSLCDVRFHGEYITNNMVIQTVQHIPDHIDLAIIMKQKMLQLQVTFEKPVLVLIFEHWNIFHPNFVMISPGASFNIATVCGHVVEPYENSNDYNYTKVKIPKGGLCFTPNHQCHKQHTQLIRFDKICCICVRTTAAGQRVNAVKLLHALCTLDFWCKPFRPVQTNKSASVWELSV